MTKEKKPIGITERTQNILKQATIQAYSKHLNAQDTQPLSQNIKSGDALRVAERIRYQKIGEKKGAVKEASHKAEYASYEATAHESPANEERLYHAGVKVDSTIKAAKITRTKEKLDYPSYFKTIHESVSKGMSYGQAALEVKNKHKYTGNLNTIITKYTDHIGGLLKNPVNVKEPKEGWMTIRKYKTKTLEGSFKTKK